jgi:hypothetical protein
MTEQAETAWLLATVIFLSGACSGALLMAFVIQIFVIEPSTRRVA